MSVSLTLLGGPCTVLRDDIVRCLVLRRPSLVALVYEVRPDPAGTSLVRSVRDASGRRHDERLDLVGCCLSCTVLADAVPALSLVDGPGRWDEVLLVLPSPVRPGPVAYALRGVDGLHVDAVTTVVDARLLRQQVEGDDLLVERGLAAAPTDRRSTAELVIGQLEDADVIGVASLHALTARAASTNEALLSHLAPLAAQVRLGPGGSGCDELVGTGRHDAETEPGGREHLATLAQGLCPTACDVTSLTWRAEQPLHPGRLNDALPALLRGVVRSRGHVWLANRLSSRVRWESAGGSLAFGDPLPWSGRPGSELALTGVGLDAGALRAALDSCIASDDERAAGSGADDPFADALGPADQAATDGRHA